jgi:CheY-like chemotaxis protein
MFQSALHRHLHRDLPLFGSSKRDPRATPPGSRSTSTGPDDAAGPSLRVLVVEDNLDQVHTLAMLLRLDGHQVDFAINGYVAIDVAERFRPEVVLLDLGLPGLDGYDVCKWLKRHPGLEQTRVIAVTGYGTEADRARARAAGCEHHLTKPYDPQQLLSLVRGDKS